MGRTCNLLDCKCEQNNAAMNGLNWFRFSGEAGSNLPTTPRSKDNAPCGAQFVAWIKGDHPQPNEGIVTRTICFSGHGVGCFWDGFYKHEFDIQIVACEEKTGNIFFLYQLKRPINCDFGGFGYCAE